MKKGDISNQQNSVIGVRFDDNLIKQKTVLGLKVSYEVDDNLLELMRYIYRRTDYTVVLYVVSDSSYKAVKQFENEFPYEIVKVGSEAEITRALLTGNLTYYIDNDDYRRSLINSEYALSCEEFNTILRRKGRNL